MILRGIIKVLTAAALVVAMLATSASPAFAQGQGFHNGVSQDPGHVKGEKQGWCAKDGPYNTPYYCPKKHQYS